MPSNQELVEMFNRGELGKFLAERFNGERGRVFPREDSDFLVVFPSEEVTPEIDDLKTAVIELYERKGYYITITNCENDNLSALIHFNNDPAEGHVFITITTHFPFPAPGQGTASLRVSSQNSF